MGHILQRSQKKLKRDFDAATSQTQASLAHAAITAESGQSIAQAAFQQTVERKKEIEHLHTTMQAAMQEHAVATETSTNQRLNVLAEELTRRVGAVVEESQTSLLAKQNEELAVLKMRYNPCSNLGMFVKELFCIMNCLHYMQKWKMLDWSHSKE